MKSYVSSCPLRLYYIKAWAALGERLVCHPGHWSRRGLPRRVVLAVWLEHWCWIGCI